MPTYCRVHSRQHCSDCFSTKPINRVCNALLAPQVELKCGCTLPVLAEACNTTDGARRSTLPTVAVGRQVDVLRDTGCATVVVKRQLVPDDKLTGQVMSCILIDGTVRRIPVALVDIGTPYYKGQIEAVRMKRPMFDLIIGNISGVTDQVDESNDVSCKL